MKVINHTPRNLQYGKLKESLNAMLKAVHQETGEALHHHDLIRIEGRLHIGISVYFSINYSCGFAFLSIDIARHDDPDASDSLAVFLEAEKITMQEIVNHMEYCVYCLKEEDEDQDLMLAERLLPDIISQIKEYPKAVDERK